MFYFTLLVTRLAISRDSNSSEHTLQYTQQTTNAHIVCYVRVRVRVGVRVRVCACACACVRASKKSKWRIFLQKKCCFFPFLILFKVTESLLLN